MKRLNRDAWLAVFLLVFCGFMFWASFDIREPDYGVLAPSVWPRVILAALSVLCLVYLVQSLRAGPAAPGDEAAEGPDSLIGYLSYWRNPIICFVLFAAYLALLPILGMLLDGIVFVFVLLCALGGWSPRQLALHAGVAVIAVGGMWSLFTFGLNVLLPTGTLIPGI
ncbi:MAG: tripartite tricarboxylate transporter TctB family protein [Hyphomicrobiales bacterium]|nr:tripartite tricarboxylate transporter TctB family protein [Hyphomicrobiales bacterium]